MADEVAKEVGADVAKVSPERPQASDAEFPLAERVLVLEVEVGVLQEHLALVIAHLQSAALEAALAEV